MLEQCRQPQALGLVDDAIDSLVKLPQQNSLVRIKPSIPSGTPTKDRRWSGLACRIPPPQSQSPQSPPLSPQPTTARFTTNGCSSSQKPPLLPMQTSLFPRWHRAPRPGEQSKESCLASPPATTEPWWLWLWLSAIGSDGAIDLPVCQPTPAPPGHRHTPNRPPQHLPPPAEADQPLGELQAPHHQPGPMDRLLPRLGWSTPQQTFLLLKGETKQLASIAWSERFPLPEGYQLVPWRSEYVDVAVQLLAGDELTEAIQSRQLEPQVLWLCCITTRWWDGVWWIAPMPTQPGSALSLWTRAIAAAVSLKPARPCLPANSRLQEFPSRVLRCHPTDKRCCAWCIAISANTSKQSRSSTPANEN